MPVTVRLPSTLRHGRQDSIVVEDPVTDAAALLQVLARRVPGFREQLEGGLLNVAINDELIVHDLVSRPIKDGDRVEIVPTISGGAP